MSSISPYKKKVFQRVNRRKRNMLAGYYNELDVAMPEVDIEDWMAAGNINADAAGDKG
jgi:hypothetical protein